LSGENRRTRRKTCPSVTLFTTNPTWIDPGAKPDLRGERPATNRLNLSHKCTFNQCVLFYWTCNCVVVCNLNTNYSPTSKRAETGVRTQAYFLVLLVVAYSLSLNTSPGNQWYLYPKLHCINK
jgi:hypothetical protein